MWCPRWRWGRRATPHSSRSVWGLTPLVTFFFYIFYCKWQSLKRINKCRDHFQFHLHAFSPSINKRIFFLARRQEKSLIVSFWDLPTTRFLVDFYFFYFYDHEGGKTTKGGPPLLSRTERTEFPYLSGIEAEEEEEDLATHTSSSLFSFFLLRRPRRFNF